MFTPRVHKRGRELLALALLDVAARRSRAPARNEQQYVGGRGLSLVMFSSFQHFVFLDTLLNFLQSPGFPSHSRCLLCLS